MVFSNHPYPEKQDGTEDYGDVRGRKIGWQSLFGFGAGFQVDAILKKPFLEEELIEKLSSIGIDSNTDDVNN